MAQLLPTDGFGIYEATLAGTPGTYQPRLQAIAAGGFKLVMNYNLLYAHIADIIGYINYANSIGLMVMVYLADVVIWRDNTYSTTYTALYADSGNAPTGTAFMQYIVDNTVSLPGVWGWYVGDEVVPGDHAAFKTYCDAIRTRDSTHPRMFVQDGHQTYSVASGTSTFGDCCEVLGDDIYPVGFSGYTYQIERHAAHVQSSCNSAGLQSTMTLQAFAWNEYTIPNTQFPTYWEMLRFNQATMNNSNPRVIMWYSYFDIFDKPTILETPAKHWADLVAVIKQGNTGSISPVGYCRG
jgi:hypothetical protein